MININEYRDKLEKRCLAIGFTKLDEPINTKEFIYCAFELKEEDEKDFNCLLFELVAQSLIECIKKKENGEFYRLSIGRKSNVIVFMSSRGDNSA